MTRLLVLLLAVTPTWASMSLSWQAGPTTAYRGRGSSYAQLDVTFSAPTSAPLIVDNTALPTGVSVQYICPLHGDHTCWACAGGKACVVNSAVTEDALCLRLTVDGTAALGANIVTISLTNADHGTLSVPLTVTVEDPPAPLARTRLLRSPIPVAAKARWESDMLTMGATYCTLSPNPYTGFGYEQHVWYYDGGRTYAKIAAYTGDSTTWMPCAQWLLDSYNAYVGNTTFSHAWRVFPHGQYDFWRSTGDPKYLTALTTLGTNTSAIQPYKAGFYVIGFSAGHGWVSYDRETDYALMAIVALEKATGAQGVNTLENRRNVLVAADRVIHFQDNFLRPQGQRSEWQSWQAGLALRALIEYYDWSEADQVGPDTRVPRIVKDVLDWASAHRNSSGIVLNNPSPPGSDWCDPDSGGCQSYWQICNWMLAPAAAWYWRKTGDTAYMRLADDLFAATGHPQAPKEWSQSYFWTWDYMDWRTQGAELLPGAKFGRLRGARFR